MATALKLEEPTSTELVIPSADLVVAEPARGDVVLFDRDAFDQFEAKLREDLKDFVPDVSTAASRKMIASKAFEVTKVKTTLEKQAKTLTEEWRTKTKAVNDGRNVIVDRLEALADEVRKPLTEWEDAEKARVEECRAIITGLKAAAVVTIDDTADAVRQRGADVWNTALDADRFGEMLPEAEGAKEDAVALLQAALARLTREEADRAELERLRAENEAREAKETAEREAREAAEKLAEEERQAEQRRLDAERAEAERIANAEKEAADKVRREAEEALQAAEAKRSYARQIIEHIKQVGLGMIGGKAYPYGILLHELESKITIDDSLGDMQDEVRTIRDITLTNVKAAMERQAEKAEAEEAEEQRRLEAAEQAKREANQAHRTKVKTEAKQAMLTCGADEETARKIVMAILAGEVPHVRMEF